MNLTGRLRRKHGKGLIRSLSAHNAIRPTSLIIWVSRPVSSTSVKNAATWVHLLLKGTKNRTYNNMDISDKMNRIYRIGYDPIL